MADQEKKFLDKVGLSYLWNKITDQLNTKADVDSPHFSGTPKAPTPVSNSNSDDIATTEFVRNLISGGSAAGTAQVTITITPAIVTTVTLTNKNSGNTFSGTTNSSGFVIINVEEFGAFDISYQNNNVSSQEIINITRAGIIYSINATYETPKTYTIVIDKSVANATSAISYSDDALGMTKGSSTWDNMPIFKDIKPCIFRDGQVAYYLNKSNMNYKEDGITLANLDGTDGDVMIEFPKFAYKIATIDNNLNVSISNDESVINNNSDYHYYAFSRHTEGDKKHFYLGAFLGSFNTNGYLTSRAGVSVALNRSLNYFKDQAKIRGENYTIFSFYQLTALQCLYLIKYGNLNGQSALGSGYTGTSNSSVQRTGKTLESSDSVGLYYDGGGTSHMKFAGIEDLWGNANQWIDGMKTNSTRDYITNWDYDLNGDNTNFVYTTNYTTDKSGYPNSVVGTCEFGFLPVAYSGSSSTYYCDQCNIEANKVLSFGGQYNSGVAAGPFKYSLTKTAAEVHNATTSRLMYL